MTGLYTVTGRGFPTRSDVRHGFRSLQSAVQDVALGTDTPAHDLHTEQWGDDWTWQVVRTSTGQSIARIEYIDLEAP